MAVLDNEPSRFTQGETVSFTKSFPSYPASIWSLTYYFRGPSKLDKSATSQADDSFAVTLTASETQVLKPGDYRYQAFVTQASEKYLVSQGSLEVIANIATQPYCESAGKSSLQTIVDALEASIKGLATKNQLEVIVGNVQIRYMSLDEKVRAHEYFSRLLAGEKNREAMEDAIASGSGTYRTFGRPVKVRFRNP